MHNEMIGSFPTPREAAREYFRNIMAEPAETDVLDGLVEPQFCCPHCGGMSDDGAAPVFIPGHSPSRWYNGEEGDAGCGDFDGCTLCAPQEIW